MLEGHRRAAWGPLRGRRMAGRARGVEEPPGPPGGCAGEPLGLRAVVAGEPSGGTRGSLGSRQGACVGSQGAARGAPGAAGGGVCRGAGRPRWGAAGKPSRVALAGKKVGK